MAVAVAVVLLRMVAVVVGVVPLPMAVVVAGSLLERRDP